MKGTFLILKGNIIKIIFLFISFFSEIHFVFILVGIAIFTDTFVGRWGAKHKAIKENLDVRLYVSSKKTRIGIVSKLLGYNLSVITVFILDKYMLNDIVSYYIPNFPITFLVSKLVGLFFLWIEFDSIDETYYKVTNVSLKSKVKDKFDQGKKVILKIIGFKNEVVTNLKDETK